jgi:hypothetical protein
MKFVLLACVMLGLAGCATSLSSMQTAATVDPGHVQVTGGYGVYLPLGPAVMAVSEGVTQAAKATNAATSGKPYQLSENDKQQLLTAGIGLATMPPGPAYELAVRTGILRDWDAGLKYSTGGSLKADTKFRVLHHEQLGEQGLFSPKFDVALGVGGGKTFLSNPVLSVLEYVKMGDFNRWDAEVPLYISVEWGEILKFWFVPKYVYSHTTMDANLRSTAQLAGAVTGYDLSIPESVDTHFGGASVGVGAGYKWVHLMLELTAGYTYCRPNVLGQTRDLGGVTLYPAVGLEVKI